MDKINFQNGVTKVNADTFNTFQNNVEKSAVVVSPTQPATNEKVWFKKGKNLFNKNNFVSIESYINALNGKIEQSDVVAGWSDSAIKKLKQTYCKYMQAAGLLGEPVKNERKINRPYVDIELRNILLANNMEKYLYALTRER